ncbi:MAG: dCTP deaminase [Actinobacteria bacterium]|nr:dCTP deaminase [Actinomycetota bacterium]
MVFSDKDIKEALKPDIIRISPKPNLSVQLGSCSIDLRLGNVFRVFEHSKHSLIDPFAKDTKSTEFTRQITIKDKNSFIMQPGDFVLAVTLEKVTISSRLIGRLEGRSSLGRLGIVVHSTASIFDPGWDGHPVLELGNLGKLPVALYPGMRICAMTFEELKSEAETPYGKKKNAKYSKQKEPEESKIHDEI